MKVGRASVPAGLIHRGRWNGRHGGRPYLLKKEFKGSGFRGLSASGGFKGSAFHIFGKPYDPDEMNQSTDT